MNTLVIVGAGGHGRVCADIADRTGAFDRIAFSDSAYDRGSQAGRWIVSFTDEELASLDPRTNKFILGVGQVGSGHVREKVYRKIREFGLEAATLIASNASVATNTAIGLGTLVGLMSTVNIGATVGDNVIVNTRALIEHDAVVGGHVHLSTGAIINGDASVGDRCLIGSGAVVLQGISICADVIVGAGAVVARSIHSPGTYVGVPARKIHD